MYTSKHSVKRAQQRGIPPRVVKVVHDFGEACELRTGASKVFISKHVLDQEIRELKLPLHEQEHASRVVLIMRGNIVLTVYKTRK